ncbi:hypothetical protein CTA1_5350 [Colletotrichum tanaceti]|uniref:Uncharacterized protein n=1 Tax=Colletotrichum tanaceti TaxID=1306861 RepID=A0A4U6XHC3_9PEZI|nr:hypothetical protein CTA1_5350 [Colletotrichum tanaceti]
MPTSPKAASNPFWTHPTGFVSAVDAAAPNSSHTQDPAGQNPWLHAKLHNPENLSDLDGSLVPLLHVPVGLETGAEAVPAAVGWTVGAELPELAPELEPDALAGATTQYR